MRRGQHVCQRRTANHVAAIAVVHDVREVGASAGNHLGREPLELFRNFYGRGPDIGPLLEYRGIGGS